MDILKETIKENGMVHFSIGDNHFVAYNETDEDTGLTGFAIAEFRGDFCGRCCGVGQRNFDHYFPSSENTMTFPCAFGGDETCAVENKIGKEDTDSLDKAKTRLLLVVGDKGHNISDDNSEHLATFIMQGTSMPRQSEGVFCCEGPWYIFVQSLEGYPIIVATFMCLVSAGMASQVRFAYEDVLLDLIIAEREGDNTTFSDCYDGFAKNIIQASRTLLLKLGEKESASKQYPNVDKILNDSAMYTDNEDLCNNASSLGLEALWKTSVYFVVSWFLLQSIALLLYIRVIPSKQPFERQDSRYCKILCREIFAAYVPILISCVCGFFSQYYFPTEKLTYFLILVGAGISTRFLVILIYAYCSYYQCCAYHRNCGCVSTKRCSMCLLVVAVLLCLTYLCLLIVFLIHLYSPDLANPL